MNKAEFWWNAMEDPQKRAEYEKFVEDEAYRFEWCTIQAWDAWESEQPDD